MADDAAPAQTNTIPLLPFRVGLTWLAVPALQVVEVVDDAEPLFLPRAPAHVPGLLNLRGTALPLLDVGLFLGLPSGGAAIAATFPRVVVVTAAEMTVGLRCTSVLGVLPAGSCPQRPSGGGTGTLDALSVAELDLSTGIATLLDLGAMLEQARVRD